MEAAASARAGRSRVRQPPPAVHQTRQPARQPSVLPEDRGRDLGGPAKRISDLIYALLRSGSLPVGHLRFQGPATEAVGELLVLEERKQALPPEVRLVLRHGWEMRTEEQAKGRIGIDVPFGAERRDGTAGFRLFDLEISAFMLDA